jgi:hypothetical protein
MDLWQPSLNASHYLLYGKGLVLSLSGLQWQQATESLDVP